MKYGPEDQIMGKIQSVFKTFNEIDKVILYGSRATGNYKEGSDIDLCLVGEKITHSILSRVDLALDDLFLPYTFDVSIYSHLTNQDFISHIKRRGVVIYERFVNEA